MKKAYLSALLTLLMVCSVSAFSFQDVLAGSLSDMIIGRASTLNSLPKTTLNIPTDSQVVAGVHLKVAWGYFDADGDEQQAYLIQVCSDRSFNDPLNMGGVGDKTSDIIDVRVGGEYYVRVKTKDSYGWGGWSEMRRIFIDAEAKSCNDGTSFWKCSRNAPLYCEGGVLLEDCMKCGCPVNQKCSTTSGLCIKQTCLDGTEYGFCSINKPYYCASGKLTEVCSLCGCPNGEVCRADGRCEFILIPGAESEKSTSILERVAIFFKGIFGGLFK